MRWPLAENKIAEDARWDRQKLAVELPELTELLTPLELDISVTGFEIGEVEQILSDFEAESADPADNLEAGWPDGPPVSVAGDLWMLGDHCLLCGDARKPAYVAQLMDGAKAAIAFLDPPYNVQVGKIVGRGRRKHREFAMTSAPPSGSDSGWSQSARRRWRFRSAPP